LGGKREKSSPFASKGIEYHIKARESQNEEEAQKLYIKSIENWERVVEITNGENDYNQLVSICWEADLIDKGEIYLRQWVEKFPNSSYAHSFLASLYELRGDIEKTKSELIISISLNTNPPTFERLAEIYVKEGNINRAIEIYKPLIDHFADDVDSGIHCGAYKYFFNFCFKNNNVNEIVDLIQHIFIKLDEFIAGKSKPKIYSCQDTEWYIYKREQFNKTIKEILMGEVERLLENNDIPKAEELLKPFINLLQNTKNKYLHLVLNILGAKIFRKQKELDKSWRKYNEAIVFCQKNEDLSMVYSEMGEQLLEENKTQRAVCIFLYSLYFSDNFYPAKLGLKRALKSKKIYKHYEVFVNIVKNVIDFDDLQKKCEDLLCKLV